jgi:hypothetical protein
MSEDFVIPEPNFPAKADEFIGRQTQIESFRQLLGQGLFTGRTVSAAVLGDWGIGTSSLLLRFAAICSEDKYRMLPVFISVSKELGNYLRFAESLLDRLAVTLIATGTLTARLRTEIQKWKLKPVHVGGLALDREPQQLFLSSGSALLKQALSEAWTRFFRPTNLSGAVFLLDDLDNLTGPNPEDMALALRAQFQSFGIDNMNYCMCFSARGDYFGDIRGFAEPAVRFYTKSYLTTFTWDEINEYVEAVLGTSPPRSDEISGWLCEKTLGHRISWHLFAARWRQTLRALRRRARSTSARTSLKEWKERNSALVSPMLLRRNWDSCILSRC